MDGAPPIGQRLGVEVGYRPVDEGQGRDGLIFDVHTDVCLHFCTECKYSKKTLNFTKLRPIRTTVYTARTCTSSAYLPLSRI